eukprot:5145522-Pyramimonas_sp.AAC.1
MRELFQPLSATAECWEAIGGNLGSHEGGHGCSSLTWWLGAFIEKTETLCLIFFSGLTFHNAVWVGVAVASASFPQLFPVDVMQA